MGGDEAARDICVVDLAEGRILRFMDSHGTDFTIKNSGKDYLQADANIKTKLFSIKLYLFCISLSLIHASYWCSSLESPCSSRLNRCII